MSQQQTNLSVLGQMLADFVDRVPGVTAAVLASADGLSKERAGLTDNEADSLCAAMSGLAAVAKAVFRDAPGQGTEQVVIEDNAGLFFVTRAGLEGDKRWAGALLGVHAGKTSDAVAIGYEMQRWTGAMREHLQDPVRGALQQVQ